MMNNGQATPTKKPELKLLIPTTGLSDVKVIVNVLTVLQALSDSPLCKATAVIVNESNSLPTMLQLVQRDGSVLFMPMAICGALLPETKVADWFAPAHDLTDLLAALTILAETRSLPVSIDGGAIECRQEQLSQLTAYQVYQLASVCRLLRSDSRAWRIVQDQFPVLGLWHTSDQDSRLDRIISASPIPLFTLPKQCLNERLLGRLLQKERKGALLPMEGQRNILVTSALPYVNNVPHLGNIIGAVLSGDVFARYCRAAGHNAIYICGTDEYGTATETKALEEGTTPEAICSKFNKVHEGIYDWFQIQFDHFGRTSTQVHQQIVHDVFKRLYANGYFLEDSVEQAFCPQCRRFLADRYIEGTCPLCRFPDARGDQCDGCGKLINPLDLIDSKCKVCKTHPEVKSSRHLFLDLTRLQPQLETFVDESSTKGSWSGNANSIAKGWLHEGLKARCMTRDLKWGTPVPLAGFEDKVFYVWFDAPIGYLSITANYCGTDGDLWRRWWQNPDNVQLYQFMGKDNVPFHTVTFPGTLLGTGDTYTMLHHINTTEYLNYESGKFSKSRGTGVFGNDARDGGLPASMWRYYLLATRPEQSDSIFSWDDLVSKVNGELIANLGNFANRTTKFVHSKLQGLIGSQSPVVTDLDRQLESNLAKELAEYTQCMEAVKLKAALKSAMAVSALGNGYLTDARLDSKLLANDPERCRTVLTVACNLLVILSSLVEPFMPSVAHDLCSILNVPPSLPLLAAKNLLEEPLLLAGHCINRPFLLFEPVDLALVTEWRARYGGKQIL